MRWGWLILLSGCAAHATPAVPDETRTAPETRYSIPWDANDNSLVCAETFPSITWMPCITVRRFRQLALDPKS